MKRISLKPVDEIHLPSVHGADSAQCIDGADSAQCTDGADSVERANHYAMQIISGYSVSR
jgi:hypothetical protein